MGSALESLYDVRVTGPRGGLILTGTFSAIGRYYAAQQAVKAAHAKCVRTTYTTEVTELQAIGPVNS